MSPRERLMALAVLVVVVMGGGAFLFHLLFLQPLDDRAATIAALETEVQTKQKRIHDVESDMPRLERARLLSLPSDVDLARREYEGYLTELTRECEFQEGSVIVSAQPADGKNTPQITGKPIYTRLPFTITGRAKLASLTKFLERFYRTSLLHEIKSLTVMRPLTAGPQQAQGELDINLAAEALIVAGVPKRARLLPEVDSRLAFLDTLAGLAQAPVGFGLAGYLLGPTGPLGPGVLAEPARKYGAIASRDIFFGQPPAQAPVDTVDVTRFWYLTDISDNDRRAEAWLYDRYGPKKTRLRAEAGFDSFWIRDEQGEPKLRGTVIKMSRRDIVFKANDNYYSIHVGQSLEEALKSPLKSAELKSLGLVSANH
jgi:hypothetical protein